MSDRRPSLFDLSKSVAHVRDDPDCAQEAADWVRDMLQTFPVVGKGAWEKRELLADVAEAFGVSERGVASLLKRRPPERTGPMPGAGTKDRTLTHQQRAEVDVAQLELDYYAQIGMRRPPDDFVSPDIRGYVLEAAWSVSCANIAGRRGESW